MKPTREMFKLGQAVFLEGIVKLKEYKQMDFLHERDAMIIKKRLAVVELTHGLELILKAILIKKGFSIHKLKNKLFEEITPLKEMIDKNNTIALVEVIKFFKINYPALPFKGVEELRKLRNQIIHNGTEINEKKREYFINAIDCLIVLYSEENINFRKFLREIEEAKNLI